MHEAKDRINITPIAKEFHSGGYHLASDVDDPLQGEYVPDSQEALEVRRIIKPELYALGAIFADRIIRRAYNDRVKRPPFGLVVGRKNNPITDGHVVVEELVPEYAFLSLGVSMRDTLLLSLAEEMSEVQSETASPKLQSAYKRLEQMLDFLHKYTPSLRPRGEVDTFFHGGINTATDVMSGILGVIPHVYKREFAGVDDRDRLIEIARNSHPLIYKLAMGHEEFVIPALSLLKIGSSPANFAPFSSKYFTFEGNKRNIRLAISDEGYRQIDHGLPDLMDLDILSLSPTTGCLAMVNFKEDSAVRLLWDWHVSIAQDIYLRLVMASRK